MTGNYAGLLGPAIRWSWVGLVLGIAGWIALLAFGAGDGDDLAMSNQMHRLVTTSLAILILGSLAVQLTARTIRGQRRIVARLDLLAAPVGAGIDPSTVRMLKSIDDELRER